MNDARCLLCGSTCAHRFTVRGHRVYRCAGCDLEFVHPTPSPEAIAAVYAEGYFEGGAYPDYFDSERRTSIDKARIRFDQFARLGVTSGRLLDLGCAAGYFADEGLARGFDAFGVEPSAQPRSRAPERARERVVATLDDPALPERFDVVTMWDVLEHLPDPDAAMRDITRRLSPDGWLGIVVPCIGNVNTRLAPLSWDQYKPPEHLWFWSLRALTSFLNARGFDVVHHDVAWTRWPRWIDPGAQDRRRSRRILRKCDGLVHRALATVLGPGIATDSIALYARTRS
jgi:SAM-dependent methyltransferase